MKRASPEPEADVDMVSIYNPVRVKAQMSTQSELVDVDFDFFNFCDIDFKALGLLLRQLFSHDASEFDFSGLSDFLIADNALGSTVKTDGEQSDPYAFCAMINLAEHAEVLPSSRMSSLHS